MKVDPIVNPHTYNYWLSISMILDTGYIYQGDADGGPTNIFDALVSQQLVSPDHTQVFKYDFETGLPPKLLYQGLQRLKTS